MRFGRAALMVTLVLLSMPLAASAQPGARVPRIGILSPAPAAAASPGGTPVFDAFREALRELGYVEGRNITLEFRLTAGNYERLRELAADLVRLPVDVIVVDGGDRVARMALDATKTIPIVMATVNDPVMNGLVASLARPGGNITGFTNAYMELAAKRLQVLKEMIPAVTRVGVLWDQAQGPSQQFTAAEVAAPSLGVQLVPLPVRGPADIDGAFEAARRQRAGALLQLASRMLFDNRQTIAERALKYRLPGVFELGFAETDALASYGPSLPDNFRRAAVYVDKILKGTRPGDLPVEQPARFYLVINLKTARALGLTIPPSVLLQATRVIK
jgi:putative ABC transport system substrate-binding protein